VAPVDADDPVDTAEPVDAADPDGSTLAGVTEAEAEVVEEALDDVSIANVSATTAPSVATAVAIRVRRVEVMDAVVPGDLKSSVRAGLRAGELGSHAVPRATVSS
jgi:hypothetical protein